jgi:hypothetical protein
MQVASNHVNRCATHAKQKYMGLQRTAVATFSFANFSSGLDAFKSSQSAPEVTLPSGNLEQLVHRLLPPEENLTELPGHEEIQVQQTPFISIHARCSPVISSTAALGTYWAVGTALQHFI